MKELPVFCWNRSILPLLLLAAMLPTSVLAIELGAAVPHDADNNAEARAHLERFREFLADEQWEEAVDTLRSVMERSADKLIRIDLSVDPRDKQFERYVSIRSYCQIELANLATVAPKAMELYRLRVDPLAERWYREGLARRDEAKLSRVVDEFFNSSFADEALDALGELALSRGHYSTARNYWERISPRLRAARRKVGEANSAISVGREGRSQWHAQRALRPSEEEILTNRPGVPLSWLAYPDTNLSLVDIRSKLILTSILEGSQGRASFELAQLKATHPDEKGQLAGREVTLVTALGEMLTTSGQWKTHSGRADWPTFAGSSTRQSIAHDHPDVAAVAWKQALAPTEAGEQPGWIIKPRLAENGDENVAADMKRLLSVHPITSRGMVFVSDYKIESDEDGDQFAVSRIRAFHISSGKPVWPEADKAGVIYSQREGFQDSKVGTHLGVPRFTLTIHDDLLIARVGSPLTGRRSDDPNPHTPATIVVLDLSKQGKLVCNPIHTENSKWAFEGTPVTDGGMLYVALRHSNVRRQAYVAAYDLESGRERWRRKICTAATPAPNGYEMTHNLLTLAEGNLFFNSNLGVVCSLRARDGNLNWLTVYPREHNPTSIDGNEALHWFRDLNPCMFHRGTVLVAPADTADIFALDAGTGQMIWTTVAGDVVHLLGVSDEKLIASGNHLWWLDVYNGRTRARDSSAVGYGRGILSGETLYWPTQERIFVFDAKITVAGAKTIRQPIDLTRRGVTGGNLVIADNTLLISTTDQLVALPGE